MKGLLKKTAGTGKNFWTVTFVFGIDELLKDGTYLFIRDHQNLNMGAASLPILQSQQDSIPDDRYDTIADFTIVEQDMGFYTIREAKLK